MKPLVISVALLLSLACLRAAPRPPIEKKSFSGRIAWWVWRGETRINRQEEGTGFQGTVRAHYLLILEDVSGLSNSEMNTISDYSRCGLFPDPVMFGKLEKNQMLVIVYSEKRQDITPGRKLELVNFRIPLCDEFGCSSVFDSMNVSK